MNRRYQDWSAAASVQFPQAGALQHAQLKVLYERVEQAVNEKGYFFSATRMAPLIYQRSTSWIKVVSSLSAATGLISLPSAYGGAPRRSALQLDLFLCVGLGTPPRPTSPLMKPFP